MNPISQLTAALAETQLVTKTILDLNHELTMTAIALGRRKFRDVSDAQHWIAGLGFVPIISNSPLDAQTGAYDYAGVIWGQDENSNVMAAVYPVDKLPLEDIKAGRAEIYCAATSVRNRPFGVGKSGTSEGAEKGWESRKDHPHAQYFDKQRALDDLKMERSAHKEYLGKAQRYADKEGMTSSRRAEIEKHQKNFDAADVRVKSAEKSLKDFQKSGQHHHPEYGQFQKLPYHASSLEEYKSPAGDQISLSWEHGSDRIAGMKGFATVTGPVGGSRKFRTGDYEAAARGYARDVYGIGQEKKSDVGDKQGHQFHGNQWTKKKASEVGENEEVPPKALVEHNGLLYTMVPNSTHEHAKWFHLESSAAKHAYVMDKMHGPHKHDVIPFFQKKLFSVGRRQGEAHPDYKKPEPPPPPQAQHKPTKLSDLPGFPPGFGTKTWDELTPDEKKKAADALATISAAGPDKLAQIMADAIKAAQAPKLPVEVVTHKTPKEEVGPEETPTVSHEVAELAKQFDAEQPHGPKTNVQMFVPEPGEKKPKPEAYIPPPKAPWLEPTPVVGKEPDPQAYDAKQLSQLVDHLAKEVGAPREDILKAVSRQADVSHHHGPELRNRVESALLKKGLARKDAVQLVNSLDDPKDKKSLIESLAKGEVERAQKEYAETPLYDLQVLSKITVYTHAIDGQANCNLLDRSVNMGTTSVTGDFRHELGHAVHGALGAVSKDKTNAMLDVVAKHYESVKEKMKAHPEGMGQGDKKMSHEWYETTYGVIGRRGCDNWKEDFAEHYRGYHKAAYMDRQQQKASLPGGNLDDYRKKHPQMAKLWDARYTAAALGLLYKRGELK